MLNLCLKYVLNSSLAIYPVEIRFEVVVSGSRLGYVLKFCLEFVSELVEYLSKIEVYKEIEY